MPLLDGARIALIEDDPIMGESLLQRLELEGASAHWWHEGETAASEIETFHPDMVVCDIRLPGMNGEELFKNTAHRLGLVPFLFITAHADIEQAVRLVRAGASDYISKPFSMDDFLNRTHRLIQDKVHVPLETGKDSLGCSEAMRNVEHLLCRVADIDSTVLLTGESGAGKEVSASFLHQHSNRSAAPFVAVNCAAIPSNLMEAELFGYEKGAFTDAKARHEGYAGRAGDGILFLDEVSELTTDMQAKLLRLVQERSYHRIGGKELLRFDARLLCATNVDLEERIRDGRFREDLYYRINVINIEVPPLRGREADVLPLLRTYVQFFSESFGRDVRGLTTFAEEIAIAHDWPGNVRELRNRAERAVALADGAWLLPGDLFPENACLTDDESDATATLSQVRNAAERRHIVDTLRKTGGRIKEAADLLGVSRTTLWEKMKKLDVPMV